MAANWLLDQCGAEHTTERKLKRKAASNAPQAGCPIRIDRLLPPSDIRRPSVQL